MSRSRPVDVPSGRESSANDADLVRWNRDPSHLLGLLEDPYCRTILEATSTETLTAREIAERGEFPLSTTYRKLDALTDAGLLEEGVQLRDVGRNPSEYVRAVDEVRFSLGEDGGIELWVGHRDLPEEELWEHPGTRS